MKQFFIALGNLYVVTFVFSSGLWADRWRLLGPSERRWRRGRVSFSLKAKRCLFLLAYPPLEYTISGRSINGSPHWFRALKGFLEAPGSGSPRAFGASVCTMAPDVSAFLHGLQVNVHFSGEVYEVPGLSPSVFSPFCALVFP